MELRNRWFHPGPFIPCGTEGKAHDYFALATACFERLEVRPPTRRHALVSTRWRIALSRKR